MVLNEGEWLKIGHVVPFGYGHRPATPFFVHCALALCKCLYDVLDSGFGPPNLRVLGNGPYGEGPQSMQSEDGLAHLFADLGGFWEARWALRKDTAQVISSTAPPTPTY